MHPPSVSQNVGKTVAKHLKSFWSHLSRPLFVTLNDWLLHYCSKLVQSSHFREMPHQNMTFARRESTVIAPHMWKHYIVKLKTVIQKCEWERKKHHCKCHITIVFKYSDFFFFFTLQSEDMSWFPNPKILLRLHHITCQMNHTKMWVETVRNHEIFHLLVVRHWVQLAGVRFKAPFHLSCAGFRYSIATVQGALCVFVIKTYWKDLV